MVARGASRPSAPGAVLARRVVDLVPDLQAPRAARAAVRELVETSEHRAWADVAELACTELVTNAVLHAHTAVVLTVEVRPDELFVAVSDSSTELPRPRSTDGQATTGRGMLLVASLASEHGTHRDPAGKTVWFTLRPPAAPEAEPSAEDLLAAWADDDPADTSPPSPSSTGRTTGAVPPSPGAPEPAAARVRLERMPPTLWLAAAEHHQTVLRELVLYLAEHPDVAVDLAAADTARTLLRRAVTAAVEQARLDGTARRPLPDDHPADLPPVPDHVDLDVDVPADVVPCFAALQDALDVAERLAAAGRLLARPGLPEIVAVRDWACEQVLAQTGGAPVAPWPGTDHARFLAREDPSEDHAWDVSVVREAARPVVAADDSNRIVALSASMAELVGWDLDDLVGRRVVTLIPPGLREGHVAGFSRHLSTGEAKLIGVTLRLPLLRHDGTEVVCAVRIDQADTVGGRRLYLAWFDPLP